LGGGFVNVTTRFEPGQRVAHVCELDVHGIVTAFMVRGQNHSYEVQWASDKSAWHLEFELAAADAPHLAAIGWRAEP